MRTAAKSDVNEMGEMGMANAMNYATQFSQELESKYARELFTAGLTTEGAVFCGAKTVKLPFLTLKGFKNHSRDGGFNRQDVQNGSETFTLAHDRDVEFFVDAMDVDETNHAASAANITNTFESEFAIPETDAYRFSKLYTDFEALGGEADETVLTAENVMDVFDEYLQAMTEKEVPLDGRILYVTPSVCKLLKQASNVQHSIQVDNATGKVDRNIYMLDGVQIIEAAPGRMKTAYDFSDGFVPAAGAKQIDMMLVHPKSVLAVNKHSYIKLWPEGSHTQGDGWLYQNRQYSDIFLIASRKDGLMMHVA